MALRVHTLALALCTLVGVACKSDPSSGEEPAAVAGCAERCAEAGGAGASGAAGLAAGSGGASARAGSTGEAGRSAAPAAGSGGGAAGRAAASGGSSGAAGAAGAAGSSNAAGASGAAGAAGASGSSAAGGTGGSACTVCESYAAPAQLAQVEPSELNALSGIAAGRKNPELFFAHNDHDRPAVYVLDMQGKLRARLNPQGASATDIEDIAIGPCDGGTCIFLADIGDNAAMRAEYAVLRFPEPEIAADGAVMTLTPAAERLRFTYEDGSHNAEGFMVDPGSGKMYVVTKLAMGGVSAVYRLDAGSGGMWRAVKVADLPVPKSSDMAISAAAAQPCGRGFAVRTYNTIYEFRIAAGASFESAFQATPVMLQAPEEPQSEGMDYMADGTALISSGEAQRAPIFATRCSR